MWGVGRWPTQVRASNVEVDVASHSLRHGMLRQGDPWCGRPHDAPNPRPMRLQRVGTCASLVVLVACSVSELSPNPEPASPPAASSNGMEAWSRSSLDGDLVMEFQEPRDEGTLAKWAVRMPFEGREVVDEFLRGASRVEGPATGPFIKTYPGWITAKDLGRCALRVGRLKIASGEVFLELTWADTGSEPETFHWISGPTLGAPLWRWFDDAMRRESSSRAPDRIEEPRPWWSHWVSR